MCADVCRPEDNFNFLSPRVTYLGSLRLGLSHYLEGKIRLDWLASEQQVSASPTLKLQVCTTTLDFAYGCWGFKLKSFLFVQHMFYLLNCLSVSFPNFLEAGK